MLIAEIQGYGAYTRIEPETLNTIARSAEYQRELAANKKAAKPKYSPTVPMTKLGIRTIPVSDLEDWRDNKNVRSILHKSIGWGTKGMTKEMLQELYNDKDWQQAVIALWNTGLVPQTGTGSTLNVSDLDDNSIAAERAVLSVIALHRRRHNIDKTGRRLPPR